MNIRIKKLGILFTSVLIVLAAVMIVAWFFLPNSPEPVENVFKEACGQSLPNNTKIISREYKHPMSIQGVFYHEDGHIKVNFESAKSIKNALIKNNRYKNKNGTYTYTNIGKLITSCSVNENTGVIQYSYILY